MKKMQLIIILTVIIILSGCMGSINTRVPNDHFGGYPYKAIVSDVYYMPRDIIRDPNETKVSVVSFIALDLILFIPFDVCADTVFLPVDLILWPFGFEKSTRFRFW